MLSAPVTFAFKVSMLEPVPAVTFSVVATTESAGVSPTVTYRKLLPRLIVPVPIPVSLFIAKVDVCDRGKV